MTIEQSGSAGVVLHDGTGVTVTARVTWSVAPTITVNIPGAIFDFFHSDGFGIQTTLPALASDLNVQQKFSDKLKANFSATTAAIIGLVVTSPPVELRSKSVVAILASGETVRVTFGTPSGVPRGPNDSELQKVFEFISTLKLSQLGSLKSLLNSALGDPNRGWDFNILSLEQVSCPCGS